MNDRLAKFFATLAFSLAFVVLGMLMIVTVWTTVLLSNPRPCPTLECPAQTQNGVVDSRGIAVGPTGPAGNCFAAPTLIPPFTSSPRP